MNYYVPDFEMEDEHHLISASSTITRHKVDDNEILELLWQDGQVIAQPQNQRKSSQITAPLHAPLQQSPPPQLYMTEDEMATWLHYPIEDLYSDLLCEDQRSPLPPVTNARNSPEVVLVRSPTPPLPQQSTTAGNFQLFSRMRGNDLERAGSLKPGLTEVDSNSTPALDTMKSVGKVSSAFPNGDAGGRCGRERLEKGGGGGEMTVSSSSGISAGPINTGTANTASEGGEDRKRKRREIDESTAYHNQRSELEAVGDEKKLSQGHSTKRSRAAEVHNLSERRRRDKINERMKALQELIPRCNKSDKASMLDEAIEYLKSLQMQVQMMSMGCNMVPMMYPGMQQQYMPPMGMRMGMGMGMDMGITRPMMPFPSNLPGSNFPAASAGAQFAPRFTVPPVGMPSVSSSNFLTNGASNQGVDMVRGPFPVPSPGMPQLPNMADPYQHYMALQQMQMMQMQMQQMQAVQNQSITQPGSSKPSTTKREPQPGPS